MLEVQNVSVRAGDKVLVDDVSLAVHPRELVALVGPNGAGKSTLLKAVSGERAPHAGSIVLNGRPTTAWPARDRAQTLAVLPQHSSLHFPFTSMEVAIMGRSPHVGQQSPARDEAFAMRALEACDVGHLRDRTYTTLSGGEQQRVQLARVLCQIWSDDAPAEPRYLLLDEPTTSLDFRHQHGILATARTVAARNIGVLAVLHDLTLTALYADRVGLMRNGRLVALGTPGEVLDAERLSTVFDMPVDVRRSPYGDRVLLSVAPRPAR